MTMFGHVQDGVVVPDNGTAFPEGLRVSVTPVGKPSEPHVEKRRVDFPLVRTGTPGTWELTNDRIAEILEEEDITALKSAWNVPA
jgi:hypothetical protein